jgi:hypothetical protein
MEKSIFDDAQVVEEKSSKEQCYHCGTLLTEREASKYYETTEYCCDGYMCGCMGMPIEPPFCDRCEETARLAQIGEAIEWALKEKKYQDDFEFNMLDVDFLVNLFKSRKLG